ncbi:MAG TPA: Ca2+-dependent phosphoinositide-specific phospholipase C, partial [Thermoanaerobaculia bacterium]
EVFQPTCHNCYEIAVAEKMGAKTFKQVLDQVKIVEIDFWDTRDAVSGGKPKEWYVRHNPGTVFQSGTDNNCTGNGNGTNNLGACLTDVNQWSDAHPRHEPVTVFLDKKQAWSSVGEERRPADLDQLVRGILGDRLYVPGNLKGSFPTLRQAANARSWPAMSDLAGKVILVLTGGELGNHNKTLSEYVNDRRDQAAIFVAADTDETSDITGTPNQFNSTTASYLVFYNIEATASRDTLGKTTRANNYVSRLWNGDDQNPCAILANCINDNALKEWNQGSCSGQSAGTLRLVNPDGWLPQQKESSSDFVCGPNKVMTGRWHDCKNKGTKCDENGNSTVYCRGIFSQNVPFDVGTGSWSAGIKESAGIQYLCPTNTVMTGRRHKGDENGETHYLCSPLTYQGRSVPVDPNAGSWSQEIVESTSQFVCPDNQILNGRMHKGDENGKTSYHCIPVPTP